MNIFEGARRVAKIGAVAIVLCVGASIWTHEPFVERYYKPGADGKMVSISRCVDAEEHQVPIPFEGAFVRAVICSNEPGHAIKLPVAEEALILDAIAEKRRLYAFQIAGYLLLGLAFYWLAIFSVGWVVRGFLGVPSGQDYRIIPMKPQ